MPKRGTTSGEQVFFEGVSYIRYPKSPDPSRRNYFLGWRGRRKVQLHVAVWESANGAVPVKHEVHHIDGNPLNNLLSNLKAIPRSIHRRFEQLKPRPCAKCNRLFLRNPRNPAGRYCSKRCCDTSHFCIQCGKGCRRLFCASTLCRDYFYYHLNPKKAAAKRKASRPQLAHRRTA